MKLFTTYVTLVLCSCIASPLFAQDTMMVTNGGVTTIGINRERPTIIPMEDFREATITTITYDLDGGNMNATEFDAEVFTPEPLHAHNVQMEPIGSHGLDGVSTNGWEEGGDYDTTQYLHLRVNINDGFVFHVDSITFTGTGTSWYGPIISGLIINDADTLAGSTVGWQVCDSVLYCVSSMWYMMPYPYDTLVNWWQVNSNTRLDLRLFAWGNIPDTLGNPMASTGWIVDHIQLHGKVLPDMSTSVTSPLSSEENIFVQGGQIMFPNEWFGERYEVHDVAGRLLFAGLASSCGYKPDNPQVVLVSVSDKLRGKRVMVVEYTSSTDDKAPPARRGFFHAKIT